MSPRTGTEPRQVGRRSKGDRASKMLRYPAVWEETLEQRAKAAGTDVGSYIAKALAEHEGFPVPWYIQDEIEKANQEREARRAEELDLPRTA